MLTKRPLRLRCTYCNKRCKTTQGLRKHEHWCTANPRHPDNLPTEGEFEAVPTPAQNSTYVLDSRGLGIAVAMLSAGASPAEVITFCQTVLVKGALQ